MPYHRVLQGDTITSIAFRYGFFPETLWNDPENADLKQLRGDGDILFPGDEVSIPDLRMAWKNCQTDRRHRFRRKGVPAKTRIQLFEDQGPRANQPWTLKVGDRITKGATDADGVLEVFIPPDAESAELTVGPDNTVYQMQFGTMDPITEVAGIQKRLNNLGFYCGDASGEMNDLTCAGIRAFQYRVGLELTGEVDDAFRDALARVHDRRCDLPPLPDHSA